MKKRIMLIALCFLLVANVAIAASSAYQKVTCKGNTCVLQVNWTSGAELMPNKVDRDFSAASAWANVDINAYDETTDLTLTASSSAQYCTLPVASFPTTIGTIYNFTVTVANIAETWTIKSFDNAQTIGTISANGANTLEWTATTTGGLRIVAAHNNSSGDFDDFSMGESFNSVYTQEVNGVIFGVETDPLSTAAPTDNYDISIANYLVTTINSTSVISSRNICGDTGTWTSGEITTAGDGVLSDRDTAVSEFTRLSNNSVYDNYMNVGPLLIDITNEGRSKSGVINIYFKKAD